MLQRTEQARGLPYDNGVAPRHFDLVDLYARAIAPTSPQRRASPRTEVCLGAAAS